MARRINRRELAAGLGASILTPALVSAAYGGQILSLQAKTGRRVLRPGAPATPIWSLSWSPSPPTGVKLRKETEFALSNELPVPVALTWRGIDGAAHAEPLGARPALAAGARESLILPIRYAGTFIGDIRLLEDDQALPSRAVALIVPDTEPTNVDRDEVFLVEDWRLRSDGSAVTPGSDPKDALPFFTVNGLAIQEFSVRPHDRLRLRFISGCQRNVIAIKIEGVDVRIMAIDSRPAEPFFARNGALVLAPGTRIDAFLDMTAAPGSTISISLHDGKEARTIGRLTVTDEPTARKAPLPAAAPLPSDTLPAQLDLKNATRLDVTLGGTQAGWAAPVRFDPSAAPAFRAKAGRTVVMALGNRGAIPETFHLHGHHFRLLDRLDDGWKPFWLDTLVVEPRQTHRIAFAAEYTGRWLMESTPTDWAASRLVASYSIE